MLDGRDDVVDGPRDLELEDVVELAAGVRLHGRSLVAKSSATSRGKALLEQRDVVAAVSVAIVGDAAAPRAPVDSIATST